MDSFQLHYVNHYEAVPGQGSQVRMTSMHPYVRLQGSHIDPRSGKAVAEAPIYIKEGVICGADGTPVDETKLPSWFWEQARTVSPEMRQIVKLVLPEERGKPPAPPKPKRTPVIKGLPLGQWKCEQCAEVMTFQKKGLHIARHNRDTKKAAEPEVAGAV